MTGDLFDYQDRYPNAPGFRRRGTSEAAANDMKEKAPKLWEIVLAELKLGPKTVHETAEALGRTVPSIQPRFSELETRGLIIDSGERHTNAVSGKSAIVWKART